MTSSNDYDSIAAAVMETERGRWFLDEFARRNRAADTLAILEALAAVENRLTAPKQIEAEERDLAAIHRMIVSVGENLAQLPRSNGVKRAQRYQSALVDALALELGEQTTRLAIEPAKQIATPAKAAVETQEPVAPEAAIAAPIETEAEAATRADETEALAAVETAPETPSVEAVEDAAPTIEASEEPAPVVEASEPVEAALGADAPMKASASEAAEESIAAAVESVPVQAEANGANGHHGVNGVNEHKNGGSNGHNGTNGHNGFGHHDSKRSIVVEGHPLNIFADDDDFLSTPASAMSKPFDAPPPISALRPRMPIAAMPRLLESLSEEDRAVLFS